MLHHCVGQAGYKGGKRNYGPGFTQGKRAWRLHDGGHVLNTGYNQGVTDKMCVMLNEDHLYVNVSKQSQIQFEDEDHAVYMSFRWVTTTLSSLRTTACDALIVPSA